MPAPTPLTIRPVGRRGLVVGAVVLGAVASVSGCSGSGDSTSGPTVTVTQTASASAPGASSAPAPGTSSAPADQAAAPDQAILDPNADLSVDDQSGSGHSVHVQDVAISSGTGHIAIYAQSGRLLGTGRVGPTVRRTTVQLSVPVPRTSELLAVLYGDDGDRKFERADPRISDEDGEFYDDTFDYRVLR